MIACPRRFDSRVECQQIGLVGDVIDDANPSGDLLHGIHSQFDRFSSLYGLFGCLAGHAIGDLGIVGILVDAGAHLLDGSAGLLHAGGLFTAGLADRLGGRAYLLGGTGEVVRGAAHFGDDVGERSDGLVERILGGAKHAGVVRLNLLGQVTFCQTLHDPDDVVEGAVDHFGNLVDPFSHRLKEAALASKFHPAVQLAIDHGLHNVGHLFLYHYLLGSVGPFDHGSQPFSGIVEDRIGDQGEGAPPQLDLGTVGAVEFGQHGALMAGIFMKAVDVGAHQLIGVEAV